MNEGTGSRQSDCERDPGARDRSDSRRAVRRRGATCDRPDLRAGEHPDRDTRQPRLAPGSAVHGEANHSPAFRAACRVPPAAARSITPKSQRDRALSSATGRPNVFSNLTPDFYSELTARDSSITFGGPDRVRSHLLQAPVPAGQFGRRAGSAPGRGTALVARNSTSTHLVRPPRHVVSCAAGADTRTGRAFPSLVGQEMFNRSAVWRGAG